MSTFHFYDPTEQGVTEPYVKVTARNVVVHNTPSSASSSPSTPASCSSSSPNKRKRVDSPPSSEKRIRYALTPESSLTSCSSPESIRASPAPITAPKRAHTTSPPPFGSLEAPICRPCHTEEDGNVTCISAGDVVDKLIRSYTHYFYEDEETRRVGAFAPDAPGGPPQVFLEYPNTGAVERFVLLQPKDRDHYNPIFDLRTAIHTIIKFYLTPEQAALFGTHPDKIKDLADDRTNDHTSDLLNDLERAFNRHQGPRFVQTVNSISDLLRTLKSQGDLNPLVEGVRSWPGMIPEVCKVIIEQTYQRSVGPNIKDVKDYEAWTSNVYGELMPAFTSDIIHQTGLKPGMNFLDLGCGVGNVVLQASLQAGCNSVGIEIMPKASALARTQLTQLKARLRMWAVTMGDAELIQGDFRHYDLKSKLANADVVLVNNFAFEAHLNEALSRLFLDLPENAIVVCLRSFVPSNFRLTQHNAETPIAILRCEERHFKPGTVSWSVKGGTYYLNYIDRSMLRRFAESSQRRAATRATRSKRYG